MKNKRLENVLGFVLAFAGTHAALEYAPSWGEEIREYTSRHERLHEQAKARSSAEYKRAITSFDAKSAVDQLPAAYKNMFDLLGRKYIMHLRDCDDMSQEFRDYLFEKGVPSHRLRLVRAEGYNQGIGHMWLEMLVEHDGVEEWRAFDVSGKRFNVPSVIMRGNYKIKEVLPGDKVFIDRGGGYTKPSDQWNSAGNCWVNPRIDFDNLSKK